MPTRGAFEEETAVRYLLIVLLALASHAAWSQSTYPTRAIRIIVPFSPGGTTDLVGRHIASQLSDNLGWPVIVDNRAGAGGNIGTNIVAKATPDGYTLLLGSTSTLAINPGLYRKLPFDPIKSFTPITLAVTSTGVMVVHPSITARSVTELVALAKSRPGKLNYASAGSGSSPHLVAEMFKGMADVDLVHIPYKGTGLALVDLLGGQTVSMMMPNIPVVLAHIRAGKLRALAVTSMKRSSLVPDVPTLAESGFSDFDVSEWFGVVGPAGMQNDVRARLSQLISQLVVKPETGERLEAIGLESVGSTPVQFANRLKSDLVKFGRVISAIGVQID